MTAIANPIKVSASASSEFWSHVKKRTRGCWEWTGRRDQAGYGKFDDGILAHRYSFAMHYWEPPVEMMVCHECDNPRCVRPDHLFLGTQKDNMHDAAVKGRIARNGIADFIEKNSLSREIEIMKMMDRGDDDFSISRETRLPLTRIRNIRKQAPKAMGGGRRYFGYGR